MLKALKTMRKDDTISRMFCLCTKGERRKNNEKEGIYRILALGMVLQLTACSFNTCKESGCDDEIYEDGYCKYHYYIHAGEDILKDIIN